MVTILLTTGSIVLFVCVCLSVSVCPSLFLRVCAKFMYSNQSLNTVGTKFDDEQISVNLSDNRK